MVEASPQVKQLRWALDNVLSRLLGRDPVEYEDVNYATTISSDGFYESSVILDCMGGLTFIGPVFPSEEASEMAALNKALLAFSEAGKLAKAGVQAPATAVKPAIWPTAEAQKAPAARKTPPAVSKAVKPLVKSAPPSMPDVGSQAGSAKMLLNSFIGKLLRRMLTKDDITFVVHDIDGGTYQAVVTLSTGQSFAGEPCSKKKDAEHSAAEVALQHLQAGSGFAPATTAPKPKAFPTPKAPLSFIASPTPKASRKRPLPVSDFTDVVTQRQKMLRSASASTVASERSTITTSLECMREWREARLEDALPGTAIDPTSLDFYFGQVCLACETIVSAKSWPTHANGQKHLSRLQTKPLCLQAGIPRPPMSPPLKQLGPEVFLQMAGWDQLGEDGSYPPVLTLGEMDYSFSLAIAQLRSPGSPLVATSYLAEHDPLEAEVYPSDDADRATFSRRSLPAMAGALHHNISGLQELGAEVLHSVDATDLDGTLRSQGVDGGFQFVVFPFPRASLNRAGNPANSRLLLNFFLSVAQHGFLLDSGFVQLVMLKAQYEEWDVNGMASSAGLRLVSRVELPSDFYQAREMSGKPWTPADPELLTFQYES